MPALKAAAVGVALAVSLALAGCGGGGGSDAPSGLDATRAELDGQGPH